MFGGFSPDSLIDRINDAECGVVITADGGYRRGAASPLKPNVDEAPSDLAIIGRYILTPDIFDELEKTPRDKAGEIQLTNGMRQLKNKRPMYGYRFEGRRHDAGNKLGFLQATVEFALKREDLGGPFREYLRGLKL